MITRTIVHGLVAAGVIAGAGMAWAKIGVSGLNAVPDTTGTNITAPGSLPDAADAPLVVAAADTGYRAAQAGTTPGATQRGQRTRDDDRWEERREERREDRRESHREDREHGRQGMNGGMSGGMSGTGYRSGASGTCDDCAGGRDDD
ncbi:hypothetical protein [uncultured Rhodospira sp.]|uniref:hypothetical protein n=1 Tax=uncultured Rhodospira sp. TaxID=1936189 RepID=UPI00260A4A40|nr:hypothetical protein [uncultured Rhodospira sp.]